MAAIQTSVGMEESSAATHPHAVDEEVQLVWSSLENLLLCQSVCKFGLEDWSTILKSLKAQCIPGGLLSHRSPDVFLQRVCSFHSVSSRMLRPSR